MELLNEFSHDLKNLRKLSTFNGISSWKMHFRWQTRQFSFAVLYQPCVPLRRSFTPHVPPSPSIVTFFLQLHCPLHSSLRPPFPFASCHHAPTQNLLIHFRRQVTRLKLPAVYGHSFRRRETRVSNYPDVKRSPLPSPLTWPPFVASIGRSVKADMTSFALLSNDALTFPPRVIHVENSVECGRGIDDSFYIYCHFGVKPKTR